MMEKTLAATLEKLSSAHVAAHREYLQLHEELLKRAHQVVEGRRRPRPLYNEIDAHRAASLRLQDATTALHDFVQKHAQYAQAA